MAIRTIDEAGHIFEQDVDTGCYVDLYNHLFLLYLPEQYYSVDDLLEMIELRKQFLAAKALDAAHL